MLLGITFLRGTLYQGLRYGVDLEAFCLGPEDICLKPLHAEGGMAS